MFGIKQRIEERREQQRQAEQAEREQLQALSEKELLIEMLIELKRVDRKCDDIARKIVIYSD